MKLREILGIVDHSWAVLLNQAEKEREIITVCSLLNILWDEGEHLIDVMRSATSRYVAEYPISFSAAWHWNWNVGKTMMMEGRWNFSEWAAKCRLINYL